MESGETPKRVERIIAAAERTAEEEAREILQAAQAQAESARLDQATPGGEARDRSSDELDVPEFVPGDG